MNPRLQQLQPYPFERLRRLFAGIAPPDDRPVISLSIGEPQHPAPEVAQQALVNSLTGLGRYPMTRGVPQLRETIADWLMQRYALGAQGIDAESQVLPVNGTREALFAIAPCVVNASRPRPLVFMPNPFYQIYEGAAILAGAQPRFMNLFAEQGFLPDLDSIPAADWQDCQLLYVCSPSNPAGAIMPEAMMQQLLDLAQEHDFVIAADECYAEIYGGEAPQGFLGVAARMGLTDFRRLLVFHSLSKRSNLPGLRSGFVAGDAQLIEAFHLYRTYHGCAMAPPTQAASIAAWQDEAHVIENRQRYTAKFQAVQPLLETVLPVQAPPAGFYYWVRTPDCDEQFTRELYRQQGVVVLPGSYLSRPTPEGDPGAGFVRLALVAEESECVAAAERMRQFL
ncbi:succinyldiaminopimelate aminotransferase apoenzyme [Ectothiorhodosinus mongolicus]|uniref:Succinyldiaminopimelate aminotransferase apoenzyme n=1 Tax=Ectothiorhodosinus mongolicus TaxID=233100 RepID=A0A1R3VMW7_9GAMM|nr:succinyldiaminopimelate transaminase [Ectothiorhodosinus mongolicus]ULX56370.1 succinyldiaminopimelate transaminase [Ectothiorhodosinus mongolicus]SIT65886.1 succinyldiaminopimelate aminotransferase apoenzyme [Ectothiorhodosinus mongolicus]